MAGNAMIVGAIALLLWCLVGVEAQATPAHPPVDCNDPHPGFDDYLITDQDDADLLRACATVNATVSIRTHSTNISLDGIGDIIGSLIITDSPVLVNISAANLTNIRGNFTLFDLPSFETFAFEYNTHVLEGIFWDDLPNFEGASDPTRLLWVLFDSAGLAVSKQDGDSVVSITKTQLRNASFLRFLGGAEASIEILNNPDLASINFTGLATGGTLFNVSQNSPSLELALPDMVSAGDLVIEDVSSLDLPVLESTKGNLTLARNGFESIKFPNLAEIGNWFNIVDNARLNRTDFPGLYHIGSTTINGGLDIANNDLLLGISSFNNLRYIWGSLDLSGPIAYFSISQSCVAHGNHVNSTIPGFDCTTIDRISSVSPPGKPNYCIAMLDGIDAAKHYQRSDDEGRSVALSGKSLAVVIAAPLAVSALLAWMVWRYLKKRKQRLEQRQLELQDVGRGASNMDTWRRSESDDGGGDVDAGGHRLPKYRKEAKPGEVPPAYNESESEPQSQGGSQLG